MVWYRDRYCALGKLFLHYNVATAPTYFYEAVCCQDGAHLFARKDSKLTQMPPRLGLQKSHHEDVV